MNGLTVLLATNRPLIHALFEMLAQSQHHLGQVTVDHVPVAFETAPPVLPDALPNTVAIVDILLTSTRAIHLCQILHTQHPELPIAGLLCCPHLLSPSYRQALFSAGMRGLLDLNATTDSLAHALDGLARGDRVFHMHLSDRYESEADNVIVDHAPVETNILPFDQTTTVTALSEDDIRLVELVALGLGNTQIGERLSLSKHTVKHRMQDLRQALGIRNRQALAAWAVLHGYYPPSSSQESS